jgi:putative ABC transport system permease protein
MLQNYIKIAWRNLVKGKLYALINIVGLAVGIASCLLIGLYIYEELRYDRFHENSDQVYRVINTLSNDNQTEKYAFTPKPLAPFLKQKFPEVQKAVRLQKENGVVRIDNQLFEQKFLVAEEGFLKMFSFPLLQGNAASVLSERDKILLTESAAQRFFGSTDIMGKRVELRISGQYYPATVGGILKDSPQYSSIAFEVVIPLEYWKKVDPEGYSRGNNWATLRPSTFVQLAEGSNPPAVAQKVDKTMKAEISESFTKGRGTIFQPLTAIHFDNSVEGGLQPTANVSFVYISVALAFLILAIACINFTSISIGLSARRAREVGMRKAVGAYRSQVMVQFWTEAVLVVLISLALGLMLTELLLPFFGSLIGKTLVFNWFENPSLLAMVAGMVLVTGFLAGCYPALYLSKFQPSQVFRNKVQVEGKHLLIRSLTGIQFALAAILIIGTLFMNQQMNLLQNKNLGFDKELVIKVDLPFREGKKITNNLQVALASNPSIKQISGVWETMATE